LYLFFTNIGGAGSGSPYSSDNAGSENGCDHMVTLEEMSRGKESECVVCHCWIRSHQPRVECVCGNLFICSPCDEKITMDSPRDTDPDSVG
jgi:hypothetical protein